MMERTRIYRALLGIRGRSPIDLATLEQLLVRFPQLVLEHPRIREIDINSLLDGADQLVALDARVVLHPPESPDEDLPRGMIRPYQRQYVSHWTAGDGRATNRPNRPIRPIRPEDEGLLAKFHETFSEQTVYSRFAQVLPLSQRKLHERLTRICFIDYDRQMVLVAIDDQPAGPRMASIATAQQTPLLETTPSLPFSSATPYQRVGLGSQLIKRLLDVGRAERLQRIVGHISVENRAMITLCQRLGFTIGGNATDTMRVVEIRF